MAVSVRIVATSLCVLALVVSAQGQGAPKTAVTGVPPFELGASMSAVLGANPGLRESSESCEPTGQTKAYAGKVAAPIGGYPYTGDVFLCFYKGSLATIRLTWPSTTFRSSVEEWRSSSRSLARQLTASYAQGLIKRNAIDESVGGRIEIWDGQGNTLTMVSNATDDDSLSITLWYKAASYGNAVHGPRPAVGPSY